MRGSQKKKRTSIYDKDDGIEITHEEQEHRKNQLSIQQQRRLEEGSLDPKNIAEAKQRREVLVEKDEYEIDLTEKEYSKHFNFNKDFSVNWKLINDNSHRRIVYDNLNEEMSVKRSVYNTMTKILQHRDGTEYEDLAFIDTVTNKVKINMLFNLKKACQPTKNMLRMLDTSKDYSIIGIHNHPSSSAQVLMIYMRL